MLTPDMCFDDHVEDGFYDALHALKIAVENERQGAVEVIASWAGVRASTMYRWLERKEFPAKPHYIIRLSLRSTAEGFTQMGAFHVSSQMRLAAFGPAVANGTLHDELERLMKIGGDLVTAGSNGNAITELADDLANLADCVREEGLRMQAQQTAHAPKITQNGIKAI